MTERAINTEQIINSGPPLSWYFGAGYRDTGILYVTFSRLLLSINGGKVEEQLAAWCSLRSFLSTKYHPLEEVKETRKVRERARKYITKATGFSPREIADKQSLLIDMFRGQKSAPFTFELY